MKRNGFSLIELVTTMTLFGTLLMISGPLATKALRETKSRAAIRQFMSVHSLAKATAIARRRLTELHIDATTGRTWIAVDTSVSGGVKDTLGGIRNLTQGGLTMTSNRSLLCFAATGQAVSYDSCEDGAAVITFSIDGSADTLTTTALGKVLR